MDEAEFLGDRVAIMSKGQLKTCGSSLFLKNKFSDAFLIEVTRKDRSLASSLQDFEAMLKACIGRQEGLDETMMHKSVDEAGRDIYHVPKALGAHFSEIFSEVDSRMAELNIAEYVVRTSSLEEVFIKIGENENKLDTENGPPSVQEGIEPINQSDRQQEFVKVPTDEKSWQRTFKAFFLLHL